MLNKYGFFEKNEYLLNSKINITFDELLKLNDDEFRQWTIDVRKEIVYAWDKLDLPPTLAYTENEVVELLNEVSGIDVYQFETVDELTGEKDVFKNTKAHSYGINQWFLNRLKTKMNDSHKLDGESVYQLFSEESNLERMINYFKSIIRNDGLYNWSVNIKEGAVFTTAKTATDWVNEFEAREYWTEKKKGYWFQPITTNKNEGFLTITREEIGKLNVPERTKRIVSAEYDTYYIRYYDAEARIFPSGFRFFRVGPIRVPTNYPPVSAKYLYEKFTESFKDQEVINIYDPSAGWGGRIAGAMSVKNDRKVHYIGNDPNPDNVITTEPLYTKYHQIADFINTRTTKANPFFAIQNTYEIFTMGSEEIHKSERFQKYKGQIDLIFTSPPYFAKEAYSECETQAHKKFPEYNAWVEGFLKPTLTTCYEWLRPNRYLLWNIAAVTFDGKYLPLEEDTVRILNELGMEYKGKIKTAMTQKPTGSGVDKETGLPTYKNHCKLDGKFYKYEPVFVFYKKG